MAVATDANKLRCNLAVTQYDLDPDATTATEVQWVDMRDFNSILVSFFRTVGTSNATFKIVANSESDGSGTDVEIKSHALAAQPNAVGDYVFLECNAEELAGAGDNLRYVTAVVSLATGTDEGVVTYIRSGARFPRENLTADVVA